MSGTPTQLVTLGKLFESHNSVSDYEKNASGNKFISENTVVYPLTPEQIEHVKKYGPNAEDDDQTAARKAEWFDPEMARSGLFDRIKARFSKKYLDETVALLGCNIDKASTLDDVIDKFNVKQVLNHIFKADVNDNDTLFSMEKFRHRPIFCGVNVLYDPAANDDKFNKVTHKAGYFTDGWKNEYNNAAYPAKLGEYGYRDITFSPKFLGDLQTKANENELIALFTRNGFSVGISSVDGSVVGANSTLPAQYSRVFINNAQYQPIYDYNTTLLRSKSRRLNPATDDQYQYIQNNKVILAIPALENEDGNEEEKAETMEKNVDHPCIIFTGITLTNANPEEGESKGYELATYTAVPICSWEYFKNSEYKGTKAVQRLEATNQCGPFTRVIAKGFYSNAISNILQTYTEIDLELYTYKDGDRNVRVFGYRKEDSIDWQSVHPYLRTAALSEYDNKLNNKIIGTDTNTVNDIEIYESAYYRGNDNNPQYIKNLFNATILPLRFAFFCTSTKGNSTVVIHIRQYPAMPLLGAQPMQDDYITQLVPMYRNLDETPTEETGMNWYINPDDILVKGVAGKFYNVSQQSYVKKTYPTTKDEGVMFTYTGHLYKGPEKNAPWPEHVEAILMGKKINDSTVDFGKIDTNLQYKTEPIMIAPNNRLRYMVGSYSTNVAIASREAYKEFIKQGCVWRDSDGNEPEKGGAIPDTDPVSLDLSIYADIEKSTKKHHSKSAEEPEEEVNKKSLTAAIIVLVVLVALIVIFIIYRVIKKKKQAALGMISQGFFCGD